MFPSQGGDQPWSGVIWGKLRNKKLRGHRVDTDGTLETAGKLGLDSISSKKSLEVLKEHTRRSCWQGGLGGAEQVGPAWSCCQL